MNEIATVFFFAFLTLNAERIYTCSTIAARDEGADKVNSTQSEMSAIREQFMKKEIVIKVYLHRRGRFKRNWGCSVLDKKD